MSILTKTFTRKRSTHVTTTPSDDPVVEFLDAFGRRDVDTAVARVADDVRVTAHGLGLRGQGVAAIREILEDIARAFPDLRVTTKRILRTGDVLTAELKVEGTQAAPYAGAINREEHPMTMTAHEPRTAAQYAAVVVEFFDRYRAHDVHGMGELCAINADFSYPPFEVWGKQR